MCQRFLNNAYKPNSSWIYSLPNGLTRSNPRQFEVDITSIGRGLNFDEFPRHFRVLFFDVILMVEKSTLFPHTFWRNFAGRKIYLISTYFFRCNFDGQKIHVVSTYSFRCNFDSRNFHVVFTYFFRRNLDGQKLDIVFGNLWL